MIYRRIYIFISHSHQDIDKVRVVRNYLESLGGEPILFFLLSQTDKDKITKLIEEEIDARIWFLLLDSEHARESVWVQSEIEFAKNVGKHNILEIPLDECVIHGEITPKYKTILKEAFEKFVRLSSIYISYNHSDSMVVSDIKGFLKRFGILLIDDTQFIASDLFLEQSNEIIKDCACVLNFISDRHSFAQKVENEMSKKYKKEIFNVILNYHNPDSDILAMQQRKDYFTFDVNNIKRSSDELIKWLYDHIR